MNPQDAIRLAIFFAVLFGMMLWEGLAPRRAAQRRGVRWPGNIGVTAVNTAMLTALPVTAVGAAFFAIHHQLGLFRWLELGLWSNIILSLLLLDLAIYWQHRIFHTIPQAWPIHRMHHTDTQLDVTTALRFHPVEIAISMFIKAALVILLGASPLAVLAFEIILNGSAMFNHSNIKLPRALDKVLRLLIVTPDMHRVHHSVHDEEYNANYGFNLSIWDRIFASYRAQPKDGHQQMQIGQRGFRARDEARLPRLLSQPFRSSDARKTKSAKSTHQ